MKKLKITKKRLISLGITLSSMGALVFVIYALTTIYQLNSNITSLRGLTESQHKEIESIQLDLRAINANNGTVLGQCLDTAARKYSNTLKSSGRAVEENGSTVYYQDLKIWQAANDTLNSERSKCNEKYK